ncbi:MAG: rod shape-determining protein [Candidatus Latescibacteria bacterium]|nr:rod shape-determining protein [Candidatus Latescibacterota bacterium]
MAFFFSRLLSNDIGIDLGTANTLVYVKGQNIVVDEPSVVALDRNSHKPLAIGSHAKQMMGRQNPDIDVIRPLRNGVIADFDVTEEMLRHFIRMVQKNRLLVRPRIVICVPSGVTAVEMRAVRESAERAGARDVYIIKEPMAAAIGIGLPVEEAVGSMVIDIGGGTTEIAVIALSGIVTSRSIKIAGDGMNQAIIRMLRRKHNLLVGERSAEQIKCEIGSAGELDSEFQHPCRGLDTVSFIPKTIIVDSVEIRDALNGTVNSILEAVRQTLEHTPPELAADILDRGIIMTGGGALLRGLDHRLMEETGLPVIVADDPLTCVVRGTGRVLENIDQFQKMLL